MTTKTNIKTPIAYYGGKQAIITTILPMVPDHEIYTEDFIGGGTLFFAKHPAENETINDRMDICINFYKVLKSNYTGLKKLISQSLVSKTMHQTATRICLGQMPADNVTRAWAFWYSCNFSFMKKIGGGIAYTNDRDVTITNTLLNKKNEFLDILATRLENTHIENTEALHVLKMRNTANAFHYLDPPYSNADQGHYKGYSDHDFLKLLTWLANHCKGKFLLSNYNSEILNEFVKNNAWHKKEIKNRIVSNKRVEGAQDEVLVWNYKIPVKRDLFNN